VSVFASEAEIAKARTGKTLVTTNGVFDVLHVGHLDVLTRAKALGDLLVVALNSDDSVRRLGKGPGRPVNPLEERAAMVLALKPVDFVVWFDDETPGPLLARLKPDVHAKGGDYRVEDLPEAGRGPPRGQDRRAAVRRGQVFHSGHRTPQGFFFC